jgi:CMP/dCMP kinase
MYIKIAKRKIGGPLSISPKIIPLSPVMKKIIIAIDGYSSCGKSTLAKALGKELHYAYVDTGAMYRAVTLHFLDNNVDINDRNAVLDALNNDIEIHFERTKTGNHVFLNGKDIEEEIRTMRISEMVSPVATLSEVRRFLVAQQQKMGNRKGVVMDGRDIGTVVFPNAELKVFLTADKNIRTQRRFDELKNKGQVVDFEAIKRNLLERDLIDSNRADSPLRQADDAILIDNSNLTPAEQMQKVLDLVHQKMGIKSY